MIYKWIRYCIVFLLMLILKPISYGQNDSLFKVLGTIKYPVASFEVGNLGELYIIDTDNQLKKLNENGDSVGVFNQVTRYGKLGYVIAQNPWKTLLFYDNFSTIVLLDKYLKVLGSINLRAKNLLGVKAITSSYDNQIWLFDERESKLKKIDDNGKTLLETVDFRTLFKEAPTPTRIIDHEGFVYLLDPQKGLYIFDYYGSLKSRLPYMGWNTFTVIGKSIYGFDSTTLFKYTPPLPQAEKYFLPEKLKNPTSIKLTQQKLYLLKDQQLSIYSLQSLTL